MSLDEIVARYNISNWSVLNSWIQCYNANRKRKDYVPKREVYMAEAQRRTTIEERKEIKDRVVELLKKVKEYERM